MWLGLSALSGFWNTICSLRRASRPRDRPFVTSMCSNSMVPSVGSISPTMHLASEVLPLPDSPTSPSTSPRATWTSTPATASTAFAPEP